MSAAEAWPRRPPGTRTRPDRSPTLNGGDSSSAGGESPFPSPALGSASSPALAAGGAFGPRLDLPEPSSSRPAKPDEERKEVRYRHEGTRLDPGKLRGIASAFGMAMPAKPPAASSPSSVSHPASSSSLIPPTSASTHSRGGSSTTSSASSSVSSFPPPSPLPVSPFAGASSSGAPTTGPGPTRTTGSGHLLSVQAPPYLASSPVLLPLLPSLKAQLAAIAREFGLPSTVGLVLFLVYENGAGEGRLGEGVWEILWRDFLHRGPHSGGAIEMASAMSDDGRPLDPSSSPSPSPATSHASLQRPRYGTEPLASPSQPTAGPSVTRYPTSQPRQIKPSESLLSRTPSTLTPASLRARKKLARLSAKGVPARLNGSKLSARRLSRTSAALELEPSGPSSAIEVKPNADVAPPLSLAERSPSRPQTRIVGRRTPSSPFPGPSSSLAAASAAAFHRRPSGPQGPSKGGAISIVGTLEWDIDERGSSQWYDRWLARKDVVRLPRPTGGWHAAARPAAASTAQAIASSIALLPTARDVETESEDETSFAADEGYTPLSEGEDLPLSSSPHQEQAVDAENGNSADDGDEEDDSAPSDDHQPRTGDPLGDLFPSDEADFFALRSARDDLSAADQLAYERPATPPAQSRPREGSVGLGLGIGLGLSLESVEQRRQKDLEGLNLTGAKLGGEESDQAEPEQGVQEIEKLLAQHTLTSGQLPVIETPPLDRETPDQPQGQTDLPPTPLKQRRKSSARDATDGTMTASNGNPLNLTLAITSPAPSAQFPTLVTSPTSAFSPTGSDATGGLAYLRSGGSVDSYASSGPSDGMLSAALEGAFGTHGPGKRGSALMMQDTLADLEKGTSPSTAHCRSYR